MVKTILYFNLGDRPDNVILCQLGNYTGNLNKSDVSSNPDYACRVEV